jgi:hypothetical protein
MSLINDALKRAKEAQQPARTQTAGLSQFRPVEPAQVVAQRHGLKTPLTAALVCVVAVLLTIEWLGKSRVTNSTLREEPETAVGETLPAAPTVTSQPASTHQQAPALAATASPAAVSATATPVLPPQTNLVAVTPATAAPPAAPREPQVKLQGIFYNPSRPSAMINGQTVFIGESVDGYELVGIKPNSATVSREGKLKVLAIR